MTAVSQILRWVGPRGKSCAPRARHCWVTWLGAAINWLLEQWIDRPELICGDADVSLLVMAGRDLAQEDGILMRRFCR